MTTDEHDDMTTDKRKSMATDQNEEHDAETDEQGTLHHVDTVEEFQTGERRLIEINGREVAIFNVDGTYNAVLNYCTHQSGPVCEGMIHGIITVDDAGELIYTNDNYLSCPWHGWTFDIDSGKHTGGTDHRLIKYDTTIRDGDVYVVTERTG